jgi:hypothetical protein
VMSDTSAAIEPVSQRHRAHAPRLGREGVAAHA